jgi:hypothetical protein
MDEVELEQRLDAILARLDKVESQLNEPPVYIIKSPAYKGHVHGIVIGRESDDD